MVQKNTALSDITILTALQINHNGIVRIKCYPRMSGCNQKIFIYKPAHLINRVTQLLFPGCLVFISPEKTDNLLPGDRFSDTQII